jgi:Secretion system C-terminal sorting domain
MRNQKSSITLVLILLIVLCTKMEAAGKVLRTYLQDENYNQSLFADEMQLLKTFNTELLVVEDYLQKGNSTAARNRYEDIPATCEFTRYDMAEWEAFGMWLDLREEMLLQGKDFVALSTSEVASLTDMAETHWNSYAGRYAQEILNQYYGGEYDIEPMVNWGIGGPKGSRIATGDVASLLKVYPNPTSDYFIVQLALPSFIGSYQLVITDAIGKIVHQASITTMQQQLAIDVQQWASGTFQISVMNGGSIIETKEINVVR